MRIAHSPFGLQRLSNQNFRGLGDRNNILWETPFTTNRRICNQFGSMWLIDGEQKNFPYILDWFYTSQNHDSRDDLRNVSSRRDEEEKSKDFWVPTHLRRNEAQNEERYFDNRERPVEDRMQTQFEASTSAPPFRESVLQHHDSNNVEDPTRSHWWERPPQGAGLPTSFLEPPNFYCDPSRDYYDHFSERIEEEEPEQHLDWRNSRRLSRTFYMDDLEAGEFNLAFDDIYRRPSESPYEDTDPANVV